MEVRTHIRIMKQSALTNQKRGFTRHEVDMVTETDVSDVISNWTGIPVTKITGSESERLLKMEETIHERIIGQKHAVVAVSKAIRRARVGLRNPNRPIASFIFAGPTGVGKTELTKALSDYMFSSEDSMIRLDMSEYMEKHTVAKLIGSPPGYVGYNEGGQLTEAVRSKPYSVVLLDEVEKAHPDVFNLLLQILDDGRLTDSKGRVIDFTNTLIIMTTNLGAKIIERESGIKPKSEQGERGFNITPDAVLGWEPVPEPIKDPELFERVTKLVNDELKNFFRPEFLNRIDEIIVFNHLTRIDIWQICGLMVKQVQNRVREKGINLIVELSVQAFLTDEGYDPLYGARPLRRAIMKYLEDTLAEQCLSKTLYPNTKIIVRRKKVEGTLLTYTNELEVEIDFSDVDPQLLKDSTELSTDRVPVLVDSSGTTNASSNSPSESDGVKPKLSGRASRFFNRLKDE
jgi:ATP-dependent Clp protease ATP-binding subunit ClpC